MQAVLKLFVHHKDGSTNWSQLEKLINKHQADIFVVGLPLDDKGKEQEMTFIARSFGRKLEQRFSKEVVFHRRIFILFRGEKPIKMALRSQER